MLALQALNHCRFAVYGVSPFANCCWVDFVLREHMTHQPDGSFSSRCESQMTIASTTKNITSQGTATLDTQRSGDRT